jgi:signal transduction histidine kinase
MILLDSISDNGLTLFLSGVFGMLLLGAGLVVFFVVYQRRIFAQIRERERAEKAHQKALLNAAVEVQEKERRRIAGDIHDEIGSLLTATRLYLRQLDPTAGEQRLRAIKEQSLTIVDEMIGSTRRISHDLLPPALAKFGFQAAAEDLCERIDRGGELSVGFECQTGRRMDAKAELALYRVLQELLNNTLKHGGASTVEVAFGRKEGSYHFAYRDDGRGFDPVGMESSGLGLRNIETRIALIGGRLEWDTAPGRGLVLTVILPN